MLLTNDTDVPLDDRPWELFENLTPNQSSIRHVDMFLSSRPIRDTASIPMSLFDPQLKRDAIPRDEGDWESSGAERNLGDGLTGEPLAAKQASTLLYASPSPDAPVSTTQPTTPAAVVRSDTPSPLPVPAARRPSTRKAGAGTSSKDAIAVEEDSSGSDLEVVEPPPAKRPKVGSKSTAKTTAGKAPAKRATGGKSVGRKATGGKNVGRKGMGGKAPRKR